MVSSWTFRKVHFEFLSLSICRFRPSVFFSEPICAVFWIFRSTVLYFNLPPSHAAVLQNLNMRLKFLCTLQSLHAMTEEHLHSNPAHVLWLCIETSRSLFQNAQVFNSPIHSSSVQERRGCPPSPRKIRPDTKS